MAATVELKVSVTGAQNAIKDLSQVSALVDKLQTNKGKIDLGINPAQFRALGQAAKGFAELQKVQNAAKATAEKTAQAQIAANAKTETALINSAGKIATAQVNADAKRAASAEKTAQEQIKADAKVTAAAERTRQEELKLERDTLRADAAMQQGAIGANAFAVALGNIAARAAHAAVAKLRQAFTEALGTMREVDQELANIQKVTDESDAAIAKVGDTAYDTASKYGVAANEYLQSAADFAKAGYDNYTQMAELATKTQLVGDVNAEVASKFLLSADAAFQFGGDMEKLSSTLDKANVIENNYATSIEKLAQGFPLVAATASMANMTVDETLAAIGTITAKTQESGTMAARALRALILNILGDTQTEIEDGVTWTEAELKTMNGLLWKYAEEPMRKAQAAGTVVNPMEAIRALHEAYETGVLTQKELTDIAMDLGGKLRTNQLLALIQNYDTFTEMLGKTADSAGSADREIDVMLGTWNAKVNQLKNSWTELVSNIVETGAIKGAIDILRGAVESLNDAIEEVRNNGSREDDIASMEAEISGLMSKGYSNLTELEKERLEYLREQTAELEKQEALQNKASLQRWHDWNGGTAGSTNELIRGQIGDAKNQFVVDRDADAYVASLDQIIDRYEQYYEKLGQVKTAGIELSAEEQDFIDLYEDIQTAASATAEEISAASTGSKKDLLEAGVEAGSEQYEVLIEYFHSTKEAAEEAAQAVAEFNETQRDSNGLSLEDWVSPWRDFFGFLGTAEDNVEPLENSLGNASSETSDLASAAEDITFPVSEAEALAAALASASGAAASIHVGRVGGAVKGSSAVGGSSAYGTVSANGGPTLVNEIGPELISDNGRAYIANGGQPAVVNLSPGAIVIPARETAMAMRSGVPTQSAAIGLRTNNMLTDSNTGNAAAGLVAAIEATKPRRPRTSGGSGGSGGSSSPSVPAKTIEELAKETKDLLSNLDKQAKLANNQGDYAKEVEIYEQAQEAIKKMVDDYRKAGYKDDSDEILDLLNKNYDYANKQLSLYQTKWDDLIDALEADTDATELANKLAEKQQAVEDAREALANAQKQRTIRMYNSATGQWEWVADQDKISSAQQKLTSAEEGYADEVKSQAIKELEAMRDTVTDLNDVILGPALSKVAMMAENSNEFQNFARALNAVYGVGSFMQSTEGTTKAISTADSHDTVYTFGNVTLTEEQASSMSVAELAKKLQVLKIS